VAALVAECQHELESGRGPIKSPPLDFDLSPTARKFLRSLDALNRPGQDWALDGLEWGIGVERLLGGVRADYRLTTDLPSLYAVGEAATGAMGADCLPGFGFAFTISSGFQAGAMAARAAVGLSHGPPPTAALRIEEERLSRLGGNGPSFSAEELGALDQELRALAWKEVGVVRVESGLREAQRRYFEICRDLGSRKAPDLPSYVGMLELRNTALAGYLIATAALERKESRGQHRRRDHRDRDDRVWLKEVVLRKGQDGTASVAHSEIFPLRYKSRHLAHHEMTAAAFPR
jgi:succinate dehydrogenase/fumarate reductase flavoprotein subunit